MLKISNYVFLFTFYNVLSWESACFDWFYDCFRLKNGNFVFFFEKFNRKDDKN